jgi:glycosyltransferase involved in cell wall biosynthesis
MRICIIGGIFDKSEEYRSKVRFTPETLLAEGLRAAGHEVLTRGHLERGPLGRCDIVHVHHLGRGALTAAVSDSDTSFVFTRHGHARGSATRSLALRYVINRADAVVALSSTEAAEQRLEFGIRDDRQKVITNAVSTSVFNYSPAPLLGAMPLRLLYVGQLAPIKGLDHLFDALAQVQRVRPVELRLVYQIAEREQQLRRKAGVLELRSVSFVGALAPAELAGEYARAHALVLPSLSESLPSVVAEAIIVGRPVVGTDVGSVAAQVGTFGVTVPPRDADALARAIQRLAETYGTLAAAAEQHSRAMSERCSVEAMVRRHEDLYTRLASGRPRRHRPQAAAGTRLGRWLSFAVC